MKKNMKSCLILLIVACAWKALARSLSPLPVPEFVDSEVTACYRLGQPGPGSVCLDFSLTFIGTASNNVELAFGRDTDSDGDLAPHETDLVVGWTCGHYFVERFRTGEIFAEACAEGTGRSQRSLVGHARVRKGRSTLRELSLATESAPAFADLMAQRPGWLCGADWNLVRLTARGPDVRNERFDVEVSTTGIAVLLR